MRGKESLRAHMLKNAITIDFDGIFASWVGTILSPSGSYIIYAEEDRAKESIKRLLRIGYMSVRGYFVEDVKSLPKDFGVFTPDFVDIVKAIKD